MKQLSEGINVSSSTYYYLLDYNDRTNWDYIQSEFGKTKLASLHKEEYKKLFQKATSDDLKSL